MLNDKQEGDQHIIGDVLDPEQEQENLECQEGEEEIVPELAHLNPNDLDFNDNVEQTKRTVRNIQIRTADERLEDARKLDEYQKRALNVAVNFAMDVIISRKGKIPYPKAPTLMIHGGAGSGKSTLINVISQYVHHILRREGDDPDCPYVILSAFTGTAAANIEGQTLHTLFSFNFGAGHMSLSDKMRDQKRSLYKNLKMLIIDEISLVDADMLYKIDLRLREITQIGVPFGNVAILVLGDLMQMRPVSGRYIFLQPRNPQFYLTSEIDPLWHKFECINLEINHRQGEDKDYADTLNRIRVGKETTDDVKILKERVRTAKSDDIKKEKSALYIFGTNANVNKINKRRLHATCGDEYKIDAICYHKTIKKFYPPEGKGGEVHKTSFQKVLRVKIGAKLMLIHNIDTCDGLTNGARGELIAVIFDKTKNISKMVIKFEKESIGREKRQRNPELSRKYPGGTVIEKVNFSFSISKSKNSVINTANVIQFPIKLAFACTAHKIQGSTIHKPQKVILDVRDTFDAAMVYVMLSRACALSQINIIDEFDESKMYPNQKALDELERLDKLSQNKNPSEWENQDPESLKISSLNCRSLRRHYNDIISDSLLLKIDMIALQETWLDDDASSHDLDIPNYELYKNSQGRGKGVATYLKRDTFTHVADIKEENMQLSKFTSKYLDIIVLYRSSGSNLETLNLNLNALISTEKPILILGDFNFCHLETSLNHTRKFLDEMNFKQLVEVPTHIQGHLLDQVHLKDPDSKLICTVTLQPKYYSDHKGLGVIIKQSDSELQRREPDRIRK